MARKFHCKSQKITKMIKINTTIKSLLIVIGVLFCSFSKGQDSLEFFFDNARANLAQRNIDEALKSLKIIYKETPDHHNINFLIGAAYAEQGVHIQEAIYHLKKAAQGVNGEYIVGSFKEQNAPIHTFYYLSLVLVQNDNCAQASQAFNLLKSFDSRIDSYYIEEVEKNLIKCPFDETIKETDWLTKNEPPNGYDPTYVEPEVYLDSAALAERGMLTRTQEYSTNAPLFGVQIGSNSNPIPVNRFNNINSVDVFVDTKGIIRYVVGHSAIRKQAESKLKEIQAKGYQDAFIVNVNDERKYRTELVSFNNVNLRAGVKGKVDFYIQLGAFKSAISDSIKTIFSSLNNISEMRYDGYNLLLAGPYDDPAKAYAERKVVNTELKQNAYLVAFNRKKKIPLKEAIDSVK